MRAAPRKGDCVICQAPEDTRVAINAAIWPDESLMKAVGYLRVAIEIAQASGVEALARLNHKTVLRHVEHIEASWREVRRGDQWRPEEVPLATDFAGVMDANITVGVRATELLRWLLEEHGDVMAVFQPKLVLDVATKLGVGAAEKKEAARLKGRGQALDVLAIFAASAGYVRGPGRAEVAAELPELRAELAEERRLLAART